MLVINRSPINEDNDEDHNEALVARQFKMDKNYDTLRQHDCISIGFPVAVQKWRQGNMDPWNCFSEEKLYT